MKRKVAEVIKEYLIENGIKQEYLVSKTNFASNTLSDVLNNKRKLTADEFVEIVSALGLDPNFVVEKINNKVYKGE